jgi:hypothetical protein
MQCEARLYGDKRCTNVAWKNRLRHPDKQICNSCWDFINQDNPDYKKPRPCIRRIGKALTVEEKINREK